MTLEEFVTHIREGTVMVREATYADDALSTAVRPLREDDGVMKIATEAYTFGVVPWDTPYGDVVKRVLALLSPEGVTSL